MIFYEGKTYAKVWKVMPSESGKYIDLQISTSEKADDGAIYSNWFPRCIGKAVNTLKNVKRGDRIVIKRGKFTNEGKKQEDGEYRSHFRFLILDADIENGDATNSTQPTQAAQPEQVVSPPKVTAPPKPDPDPDCPW